MATESLQDKINRIGNPVEMLRNAQMGPYQFPIKAEFTNWRDEQEAWRSGAALFDQSFHMTDHYIEGRDVKRFIESLVVNSMSNFRRDIAKQVVFCNPEGQVVADAIMFVLEDDKVQIVNKPTNRDWVQYHLEQGGFDVRATTDDRALDSSGQRKCYRFEVQGPNAWDILEALNGGPIDGFKFFTMGSINIAGRQVRALRHGMAGAAGLELFGPFEDHEPIRDEDSADGRTHGTEGRRGQDIFHCCTRKRLVPVSAASDLFGGIDQGLPRMARRRQLHGEPVAWGILRF